MFEPATLHSGIVFRDVARVDPRTPRTTLYQGPVRDAAASEREGPLHKRPELSEMLTPDEVRGVPIFAELGEAELERLAKRSADIQLQPGEYAAHEGEGRALLVVLEGEASVTKSIDGIERVVGRRTAGELFGEVPIVLGSPFLANLRAVTAARVMRIEPRDFHAASASAPELSARVGALAQDRIEGLHDIAADQPAPRATIVGERYDPQCRALRDFLDRNGVTFDWITPDDPHVESRITGYPRIKGRYPAVLLEGGGFLVQPERRELARRLGLTTMPAVAEYDTVIIGGGPAGLAAAVYGASEGLRTLMIEREAPGGQAGTSSRIENYLGFPNGVTGGELAGRALAQAKRFGAEILVTRCVLDIDAQTRQIELDGGEVVVRENRYPGNGGLVAPHSARRICGADGSRHLLRCFSE